MTFRQR